MQVAPIASEPLACQQFGTTCWRFLSLGGSDEWAEHETASGSGGDPNDESLESVTSLGGSNKGALRLVKCAALS